MSSRRAAERVGDAGHGQQGIDRDDGVGGADHHRGGSGDRLEHPGARPGAARPRRSGPRSTATSWRSLTKYSWNPTSVAADEPKPGAQRVVGDRQEADADAEPLGQLGGDRRRAERPRTRRWVR